MTADSLVLATEFARGLDQRKRTRRRFLIRRHTSRWCAIFPNTPAWMVWDRETGKLTPHATHADAVQHACDTAIDDAIEHPDRPHRYVPGYGWTPIEEPSA